MSVYFISAREVDLVKIGCAYDPVRRFLHLRIASPIELTLEGAIAGGFAKERELHRRFAKLRVRGEWFMLSPELREEIEASSRPEKYTKAAVKVWLRKLKEETGPEAMVRRIHPAWTPDEREKRDFDNELAKALGRSRTLLEKLADKGEIYFPFRATEAA